MTLHWSADGFRAAQGEATWQRSLTGLAFALAALLAIFGRDVRDLADIYWNSTTFAHCLFVIPIVGWLVWQRAAELAALRPVAWLPGLLPVVAGAGVWFVGEIAGVALARHLGLILMVQGSVVALLGPNVGRALIFPLFYLLFLIPFGDFLEEPLQAVTVAIVMPLLHLAGVLAVADGVLITIPNGYFEVAEACSGAKFVIAMAAYGALVANVCFISWRRRIAFLAVAVVVPMLANGLRAFGTIYAAHLTSVRAATGFDHIVYGWVFFGVVMAAVLAAGWRWFDRDPDAPWVDAARLQGRPKPRSPTAVAAAVVVLALATYLAGTAVAARADRLPDTLSLPQVPGWQRIALPDDAWRPWYPSADRLLVARYVDARGRHVDVGAAVFAGQHEGHELVGFGQGLVRENDAWIKVTDEPSIAGGRVERIRAPGPVERRVATWYHIAGTTTASERRVKIETVRAKLLGGPQAGVALHLAARHRDDLTAFLAAAGPPGRIADAVVSGR